MRQIVRCPSVCSAMTHPIFPSERIHPVHSTRIETSLVRGREKPHDMEGTCPKLQRNGGDAGWCDWSRPSPPLWLVMYRHTHREIVPYRTIRRSTILGCKYLPCTRTDASRFLYRTSNRIQGEGLYDMTPQRLVVLLIMRPLDSCPEGRTANPQYAA
ncbi:hypothetical protein BDV38DRAFT_86194 [Aspergillus pseudotamarii]|uniref:Uncharacterized protein n=1 Tax=Aspergillus pseudotamarii TaxID=132259 RepID=A0A5N6SV93_ASPPS|nr:uncharacterized protein BDV38DRAFT_86194 [Aspergillus pseudotamarii]KAE8137660.1 hypothetical protein BDV38DRAFT_86194 [Aspergillus pseudotamarii]